MSTPFGRIQLGLAFLAAGLLVATPSLCLAGVLQHVCECEDAGHTCDCPDRGHNECTGGCSHDGCTNDPCKSRPMVQPSQRFAANDELAPRVVGAFIEPAALFARSQAVSRSRAARYFAVGPPGGGKRLSCHPSDLPLLL